MEGLGRRQPLFGGQFTDVLEDGFLELVPSREDLDRLRLRSRADLSRPELRDNRTGPQQGGKRGADNVVVPAEGLRVEFSGERLAGSRLIGGVIGLPEPIGDRLDHGSIEQDLAGRVH